MGGFSKNRYHRIMISAQLLRTLSKGLGCVANVEDPLTYPIRTPLDSDAIIQLLEPMQ